LNDWCSLAVTRDAECKIELRESSDALLPNTRMKRGVGFYVRKYEKAFLVAALCFSALAPLLKYTLSSAPAFRQTWDEPSSGVVERSPHADQSQETATRDAMQPLPTPIVCTYADRELSKWQACNKKKFKVIPSCKRGISKCVLLPLYKQKVTPFCGDCINEWKKVEDCYKEAETYALTMRRCVKVSPTQRDRSGLFPILCFHTRSSSTAN